jgi:hypothetical protein
MTVLTMRAHKRFVVRQPIWLRRPLDGFQVSGWLIELSAGGCRISNLGSGGFSTGDRIIVEDEMTKFAGQIRWTRRAIAGVLFEDPLGAQELSVYLLRLNEGDMFSRYGT